MVNKEYKIRSKKESPVRTKIMSRARTLFGRKGYQNTMVRDIAAAYGCEAANIYNFFEGKEDILFQILSDEMEAILIPIRPIADDEQADPVAQLRAIFKSHGDVTLGKRRISKVLFDASLRSLNKKNQKIIIEMRDEYDRILRVVIQRGIDAGIFEKTDVKMASFAIASMIARARIWYRPKGSKSADEIIDSLFLFALKALGCRQIEA